MDKGNILHSGQFLAVGDRLTSQPVGAYFLSMQADGNLVIYKSPNGPATSYGLTVVPLMERF